MPIFWMWIFAAAQFLASYVPLFSKLQYSRHFRYYKRVTEETYHVFVGPRAYHTSIDRKGDAADLLDDLSKALVAEEQESDSARRRAFLLVGKAGIGKSQLAIDVAGKLDCRLMSPKPDTLEDLLASVWLKWSKKDGILLFLDDLNHLVKGVGDRQVLQQIITEFMTQRGSVLATCRAEAYRQLETANLGESTFQIVNIPDWSEDEGRALSDAVGKPFAGSGFDGTPLSITMGFKRQAEVYAELPSDARGVLRALKLLYAAGLLSKVAQPTRELLRKAAVQILGVNDFHSSLTRVTDAGLAYVEDGAVFAYEGTLERVVKDFPNDTGERWLLIGLLSEVFTTRAESPFAFNAGVSSYLSGYVELAATFWSKAVELDPTDAQAYYNRGVARGEQGDHDGAMADYNKAIEIDPAIAHEE